jgi:DnaJ like chaperone protein
MRYPFLGKVLAGLAGLATANFLGLVLGLIIGHVLDLTLLKNFRFGSSAHIDRIRHSFFETTFLLLGHLAKADGRISQSETDYAERVIAQMTLGTEQQKQALALFRQGASSAFELEPVVAQFVHRCGNQQLPQKTLLLFLISLAQAEQGIAPSEQSALARIARLVGVGEGQLANLLRMANAQQQFHQQGATSIEDAYAALGISSDASDAEVKRALQTRMSENDPEKLIANGVPEELTRVATEHAQEIQAAYGMIKQTRQTLR